MKVAGLIAFVILATANSGGYRYGVSDQAFYLPAVYRHLSPELFPRDAPLLEAQANLMASDDVMAAVIQVTGASLPHLAAALYLVALVLLIVAAAAFARGLAYSWWAVTLFGVLLTFRHRIAKTGANSLEGYMHPRELAFAIGIGALACVVRGRHNIALLLVAVSAVAHPTTALFFGLVVAVAAFVSEPRWRLPMAGATIVGGGLALWTLTAGPLAGRLIAMDAEWLNVLSGKDYLFPAQWPIDAWLLNLAYPFVILAVWRMRKRRGLAVPHERGLVAGLMASLVVFLLSVPLTMADVALAVQLQITRVFWILDFVAIASIAWWLSQSRRVAIAAITVCTIGSTVRGYYLLEVDPASAPSATAGKQGRQLVSINLPDTEWMDAMRWLEAQPADWHVLADPGHAWKYGVSVRVAARKDTVIEGVKDSALAMYDRDVAMRVADRTRTTVDYDQMSMARVRALDAQYDLDAIVVVAGLSLELPLLYRNAQFAIYDVR